MENLGAMAYSRYTGFRKITDRDVLELHCISILSETLMYKLLGHLPYLLMCPKTAGWVANSFDPDKM